MFLAVTALLFQYWYHKRVKWYHPSLFTWALTDGAMKKVAAVLWVAMYVYRHTVPLTMHYITSHMGTAATVLREPCSSTSLRKEKPQQILFWEHSKKTTLCLILDKSQFAFAVMMSLNVHHGILLPVPHPHPASLEILFWLLLSHGIKREAAKMLAAKIKDEIKSQASALPPTKNEVPGKGRREKKRNLPHCEWTFLEKFYDLAHSLA